MQYDRRRLDMVIDGIRDRAHLQFLGTLAQRKAGVNPAGGNVYQILDVKRFDPGFLSPKIKRIDVIDRTVVEWDGDFFRACGQA